MRVNALSRSLTFQARALPPVSSLRSGYILFMLAHVPAAIVMDQVPPLAGLHAFVTLGLGLKWALSGRQLERVAYASAYIVGAEVLWRMTNPNLPWEFGKYALVAVNLVALIRLRFILPPLLPFLYFAFLLPSAALTMMALSPVDIRKQLSFNLSGPLALFVACWFFSKVHMTPARVNRLLLSVVAPSLGIASIAFYGIVTSENIVFTTESNSALSGGFGPNQVSSALGLGALMAFWATLDGRASRPLRTALALVAVFLSAQSVLTFSRGGIYATIGAIAAATPFLLRDRGVRARFVTLVTAGIVVTYFYLLPKLDAFTQGNLVARFEETSVTHRDEIGWRDIRIWFDHPLFGVGPGMGSRLRSDHLAAHTELTRIVAEHGSLGAAAGLLLLGGGIANMRRLRHPRDRALVAALIAWSVLYMLGAAMRLAAPSLMFGLVFALWPSHPETLAAVNRLRAASARPPRAQTTSLKSPA
jgi:hypothetical protein